MSRIEIAAALAQIFEGIQRLQRAFPHRAFTIDGRLVGDIGEVIAALEYDLILDDVQRPLHDARTADGRDVQIKATFKNQLTLRGVPDYYLGFRLHADGEYEEIYNGPAAPITVRYGHRKGFGSSLLSFPISELRNLSRSIPAADRISKRARPTPFRSLEGD